MGAESVKISVSHVSSHDKASAWKRHEPPNRQNDSTCKPDFVSVHPRTAQRAHEYCSWSCPSSKEASSGSLSQEEQPSQPLPACFQKCYPQSPNGQDRTEASYFNLGWLPGPNGLDGATQELLGCSPPCSLLPILPHPSGRMLPGHSSLNTPLLKGLKFLEGTDTSALSPTPLTRAVSARTAGT